MLTCGQVFDKISTHSFWCDAIKSISAHQAFHITICFITVVDRSSKQWANTFCSVFSQHKVSQEFGCTRLFHFFRAFNASTSITSRSFYLPNVPDWAQSFQLAINLRIPDHESPLLLCHINLHRVLPLSLFIKKLSWLSIDILPEWMIQLRTKIVITLNCPMNGCSCYSI